MSTTYVLTYDIYLVDTQWFIAWDYILTSFVTEEDVTDNVLSHKLLNFYSKSGQVRLHKYVFQALYILCPLHNGCAAPSRVMEIRQLLIAHIYINNDTAPPTKYW